MMNRNRNRSDSYQNFFAEQLVPSELLSIFSNNDSISYRLNPFYYNEELMDLEEQLKKEFWRIVDNLLTPRQKDVIRLAADGYTQTEIARLLSVNQSSITKSINGNVDYKNRDKNGKNKKSYGGSKRKLKKIIEEDEKIKAILARIQEIRDEKW